MTHNRLYGLIGKELGHSFSKKYFDEKFCASGSSEAFSLFPLSDIEEFPDLLRNENQLVGLAVTIPYKQAIIPFLQQLDDTAQLTGAVNCIRINEGVLKGFNTDVNGFDVSLSPLLKPWHTQALVFGSGGASLAVQYVLKKKGITYSVINRSGVSALPYAAVNVDLIAQHTLLINCTPLGMYPQVSSCVPVSFDGAGNRHLFYDLVYNPEKTIFLQEGEKRGATIKNGLEMLYAQAEENYRIWNE